MKMENITCIIILALVLISTMAAGQTTQKEIKKNLETAVRANNDTVVRSIISSLNQTYGKKLLNAGYGGDSLFSQAIKSGQLTMVELLVELGADFTKKFY
ncbi:unnamed protein product, partial [Meganyctiphanes norvegica]